MKHLTEQESWNALQKHAQEIHKNSLLEIKSKRSSHPYIYHCGPISLDLNHQKITEHTLSLLVDLANENQLPQKIHDLFTGEIVNSTEQRPALHTALRQLDDSVIEVDGENVVGLIHRARLQMIEISAFLREGQWLGYTGKPITDVINIGIGGSDLGPRLCIHALRGELHPKMRFHFITSVDPFDFASTVEKLNPETCLFIISSKSFTTQETITNAQRAKKWLGLNKIHPQHFIAVTANVEKAHQLGFSTVIPIWAWVGGRYSFCSAINLITMIAIGAEKFMGLLAGANCMDHHFHSAPLHENLPALLGLVGVWNNNFLDIHNFLMLPYAQQLEYLVPYVQQLDMESNGKSVNNEGKKVNYATGPVVWGGLGNQAQHSFFQLLCQGTHRITGDCIGIRSYENEMINHFLLAKLQVLTEGVHAQDELYKMVHGNIPLNLINLDEISPYALGALLSLYEHKVYTQSVIWNINPFDQPGVETAKRNFLKNNELVLNMDNF